MMKKSIFLLMISALLSGASFMVYLIIERVNNKRLTRQRLEYRDNFPIYNFDSTRLYLSSNHKSILVYFDSECDHCQNQLKEIFSHKNFLDDFEVVLISSELISTIRLYAEKNYPDGASNIRFTKINETDAHRTFGSLVVPQIFIYGNDGTLIKEFKGETKMEAVLQYL